jgi:hypothetical protein
MLLKPIRELPRLLLLAHFDAYGIFLAFVYKINPKDRKLNYFRALFFIGAVDVLFGMNVAFTLNNLFDLPWVSKGTGPPAGAFVFAIGMVLVDILILNTQANRYRAAGERGSPVPRAEGPSSAIALSYIVIQLPWLLINSAWHHAG